jgi:predicted MPP superfamily phosphohydrolase
MVSRRAVLLGLAFTALAWTADPAAVEFVHLSDTHVANLKIAHPGLGKLLAVKKDAVAHLETALQVVRREVAPSFVLITGDLTDGFGYETPGGRMEYGQIDVFKSIFDRSPVPIYPVLGNHDITQYRYAAGDSKPVTDQSPAADARREWRRLIPNFRDGTYYAFPKQAGRTEYLFIVLDDGEARGRNDEYAATQLAWLRQQIAAHPLDSIILAMHIPLEMAPFWRELKPILANAPNVVLSIAGHRHSDGVEEVDLGARKLLQVRTAALFASDGNWRKLRLCEDRIEIFATGKKDQIEKTLEIRHEAVSARNLFVNPVPDPQVPLSAGWMRRLP